MKALEIRVLRGPNYWSDTHNKVILIKIDLENFKDVTSDQIKDFNSNLQNLLPSLVTHKCFAGEPEGFFEKLSQGLLLGHVIEHVALELQCLAGMQCGYGKTRYNSETGIYTIVFSYEFERAGQFAAQAALNLTNALASSTSYLTLQQDIQILKDIADSEKLGPSTDAMVREAKRRSIPYTRLDSLSLVMFGQGCNRKMIRSTITTQTSLLGADFAADKDLTKKLLASELVPVPFGEVITSLEELDKSIQRIGFPVVIKPQNANHGRGVTTNIKTRDMAVYAFTLAKHISDEIIVEKFINGQDYRVLVINYKFVAAAKRESPLIVGDGTRTIQQLIDEINQDPLRGSGHDNILTKIEIDEATTAIFEEKGLKPDSILKENQSLKLKYAANISTGGTAEDVTSLVHPNNIFLAERIARIMNLDICGIDLIAEDIAVPIKHTNGAIIEINAAPGLRMHLQPSKGKKRNVARKILDMLYPPNSTPFIPITAVTGTNGKTTVVRLIAHIAHSVQRQVGFTTTEGIYINNFEIYRGDCSGPSSAGVVLRDPMVDFAVFECARGGILRSGLGFNQCDVGVVTNISSDHLGIQEIQTIEDMAKVKSVVPRQTKSEGYAILNADDDLVYNMRNNLECHIALFSIQANNPRIIQHNQEGGLAIYVDNHKVMLTQDGNVQELIDIMAIPITHAGKAKNMIRNILPAILACIAHNFTLSQILSALKTFYPDPDILPGRMNLFHFESFTVMLDYAHNTDAFVDLKDYFSQVKSTHKVGIIAATGDRRSIDIINIGRLAAEIFDEIIIRQDTDTRGATPEWLSQRLIEGIKQIKPHIPVQTIPNEFEAIQYALDHAIEGSFIFYFPEKVMSAIEYMKRAVHEFKALPKRARMIK